MPAPGPAERPLPFDFTVDLGLRDAVLEQKVLDRVDVVVDGEVVLEPQSPEAVQAPLIRWSIGCCSAGFLHWTHVSRPRHT